MEHVTISNRPERFDEVVHGGLPEGRDLEIVFKHGAMESGAGAVVITFSVQLPDGKVVRCQAVTSCRAFLTAADGIRAYDQVARERN